MKRKAIPNTGVHLGSDGKFYSRPWVNGRRTWRRLKATTIRKAIKERATAAYTPLADDFESLAKLYMKRNCPNKKLQPRPPEFCRQEIVRVNTLIEYYGGWPPHQINLRSLNDYYAWRKRHRVGKRKISKQFTMGRATDKDIQTLSNVINFGVFGEFSDALEVNKIRENRPRYQGNVRHSREVMPESAEVIHDITDYFLKHVRSEVMAWLAWFSMFSGCRTSELLRLRLGVKTGQPGCIRRTAPFKYPEHRGIYTGHGYIDLGRRSKSALNPDSKDGLNPWLVLWPEFDEMLDCFIHWHHDIYGRKPNLPYFPGADGFSQMDAGAFGHALTRACGKLKLPHIVPHGFRSYFSTKLHRDGFRDEDVAAAIGDKTVALVQNSYRDCAGGETLSWIPSGRLPGWLKWQAKEKKIIQLKP